MFIDDGYRCLTSFFFRLLINASVAKIQPDKVVRWCQNGDFFSTWCTVSWCGK